MAQDMKRELIAIIGEMKDPRVTGGLLTVTRLRRRCSGHSARPAVCL